MASIDLTLSDSDEEATSTYNGMRWEDSARTWVPVQNGQSGCRDATRSTGDAAMATKSNTDFDLPPVSSSTVPVTTTSLFRGSTNPLSPVASEYAKVRSEIGSVEHDLVHTLLPHARFLCEQRMFQQVATLPLLNERLRAVECDPLLKKFSIQSREHLSRLVSAARGASRAAHSQHKHRDAATAQAKVCSGAWASFLGGMEEGRSYGLRKWFSDHGSGLAACGRLEACFETLMKMKPAHAQELVTSLCPDSSSSSSTSTSTTSPAQRRQQLSDGLQGVQNSAAAVLRTLGAGIPVWAQDVAGGANAHPHVPFWPRLILSLQNLRNFDPEDDDVVEFDPTEESQAAATTQVVESQAAATTQVVESQAAATTQVVEKDGQEDTAAAGGVRGGAPKHGQLNQELASGHTQLQPQQQPQRQQQQQVQAQTVREEGRESSRAHLVPSRQQKVGSAVGGANEATTRSAEATPPNGEKATSDRTSSSSSSPSSSSSIPARPLQQRNTPTTSASPTPATAAPTAAVAAPTAAVAAPTAAVAAPTAAFAAPTAAVAAPTAATTPTAAVAAPTAAATPNAAVGAGAVGAGGDGDNGSAAVAKATVSQQGAAVLAAATAVATAATSMKTTTADQRTSSHRPHPKNKRKLEGAADASGGLQSSASNGASKRRTSDDSAAADVEVAMRLNAMLERRVYRKRRRSSSNGGSSSRNDSSAESEHGVVSSYSVSVAGPSGSGRGRGSDSSGRGCRLLSSRTVVFTVSYDDEPSSSSSSSLSSEHHRVNGGGDGAEEELTLEELEDRLVPLADETARRGGGRVFSPNLHEASRTGGIAKNEVERDAADRDSLLDSLRGSPRPFQTRGNGHEGKENECTDDEGGLDDGED